MSPLGPGYLRYVKFLPYDAHMLGLWQRRTARKASDEDNTPQTSQLPKLLLIIVASSLFITSVIRNLQKFHYTGSPWTEQYLEEESTPNASASKFAHLPPGQAFVVTGVQTGFRTSTDERPPRLEISDFEQSGPAFDLYIQCQNQIMARSQEDPLSYYGIASIHQKPYKSWNSMRHPYGIDAGYAPHGSILFPIWHRPYVAMYEQLISDCAVSLAEDYPAAIRSLYYREAQSLRLPYWDWARNHSMPALTNEPTCLIRTPTGVESVVNPLYRYEFHPVPGTVSAKDEAFEVGEYKKLPHTVRNMGNNGISNIEEANKKLNEDGQFMQLVYGLFKNLNGDFAHFSNKAASEASERYKMLNIENIHNHVHELIAGHMGTNYAAFDPIFWLHHANIDRIVAMWQAANPESYVTPQVNVNGTRNTDPGTVEDADSPLMPFASDHSGHMHTAQTIRQIKSLGYTYPEIKDWTLSPMELTVSINQTVESLYGNTDFWIPPKEDLSHVDGEMMVV